MKYFALLIISLFLFIGCADKGPTGIEGDKDMDYKNIQNKIEESKVSPNLTIADSMPQSQKTRGWRKYDEVCDSDNRDVAAYIVLRDDYLKSYTFRYDGNDWNQLPTWSPANWVSVDQDPPFEPFYQYSGELCSPPATNPLMFLQDDGDQWRPLSPYTGMPAHVSYDGSAFQGMNTLSISAWGIYLDEEIIHPIYFYDPQTTRIDGHVSDDIMVWSNHHYSMIILGDMFGNVAVKAGPDPRCGNYDVAYCKKYNKVYVVEKRPGYGGRIFKSTVNSYNDVHNPWVRIPGLLERIDIDHQGNIWGMNTSGDIFQFEY